MTRAIDGPIRVEVELQTFEDLGGGAVGFRDADTLTLLQSGHQDIRTRNPPLDPKDTLGVGFSLQENMIVGEEAQNPFKKIFFLCLLHLSGRASPEEENVNALFRLIGPEVECICQKGSLAALHDHTDIGNKDKVAILCTRRGGPNQIDAGLKGLRNLDLFGEPGIGTVSFETELFVVHLFEPV